MSLIIAIIVSVLLFEAFIWGIGVVTMDWTEAVWFAVFMHLFVGIAACVVAGLTSLWMWALP